MSFERERERDLHCVLLGSGGWMPTPERATSCLLLRKDDDALLLDAGTAVATVCRGSDLLGSARRLDVVISHFHLDHVAGLAYLPSLAGDLELTVWAPGRLLRETSSLDVLSTLVGGPYLSADIADFAHIEEISEGSNQVSSWSIEARVQPRHPGGSVGFRVGDSLAYCTDTAPDPDCARFVQGVDLLVHEAWTATAPSDEHSSASSAAGTAAEADVGRLVLSHVHPLNDDPAALLAAARPVFANTEVGHDGQTLY